MGSPPVVTRSIDEAFCFLRALDFQLYPSTDRATFYGADGSPSVLDYFFVDQSIRVLPDAYVYRHHIQIQHRAIRITLEFSFANASGKISSFMIYV